MSNPQFHILHDEYGGTRIYPFIQMDQRPTFHANIFVNMDGEINYNGSLNNVTPDDWEKFKAAMDVAFQVAKEKQA